MKTSLILALLFLGLAGSALAIDKEHLDGRMKRYMDKLDAMQQKPDKAIPAENFKKAKGIILLERTKAGVVFAFQSGKGVALVRNSKTQKWGPASWVTGTEASLGAQIGGESAFYVVLLMTTNSIRMVRDSNFEFGGEVSGTAGDSSGTAKGTSNSTDPVVLIYDDKTGFFGGAAIKGDSLNPDTDANVKYYGESYTMKQIISGEKVKVSDVTAQLIKKLDGYSKGAKKEK
jgi:lipid-binding SYLF domain-containing protein